MGGYLLTIIPAWNLIVPLVAQEVRVNGSLRPDIECLSITQQQGLGGCRATFAMPREFFDADVAFLRTAEIVVFATHVGYSSGAPLFRGLVDSIDGRLAIGTDDIGFSARSWITFLGMVQVGQVDQNGSMNFRRVNRTTGALNNWTVRSMVEFAFSSLAYPEDWNALLAMGDTSALTTGTASQAMATDIQLTCPTYAEFLGHMLSLAGDISVRERFTSSITYFDFYRLGPDSGGANRLRVAALGESVVDGANVVELDASQDLSGIATHVIGYTAPKRMVVTFSTADILPAVSLPLEPAWLDATNYADPVLTVAELAVLKNPECAKPGGEGYLPGYEDIFRKFRLPTWVRNYSLDNAMPIEDAAGAKFRPQAFRYVPELEEATVGGIEGTQATGTYDADPELLSLDSLDADNFCFTLADPAIEFVGIGGGAGNAANQEFARAQVHFTCSLSLDGIEGGYDTGIRGTATPDALSDSGLTQVFSRPDLEVSQFTNLGLGFDAAGTYPATYFNHDSGVWTTVTAQTTIRDERETAARMAEAALRSRSVVRHTYQAGLDYLARGLRVGDTFRIDNGGEMLPPVQISAITWRVSEDASTTFVASDTIPEEVILPDASRGRAGAEGLRQQIAAGVGLGKFAASGKNGVTGIPSQREMIESGVAGIKSAMQPLSKQGRADSRLAGNTPEGPQFAPGNPNLVTSRTETIDAPKVRSGG